MSEERDLRALLGSVDEDDEIDPSDVAMPPQGGREGGARSGAAETADGRSAKHAGGKRTHLVPVRFNDAEWDIVQRRRDQAGAHELSAYVRSLVLGARPSHGSEPAREPAVRFSSGDRTHCIMVRVNAGELATLETRRAQVGEAEMGMFVRRVALARRPLQSNVPELNRQAWVELIARLSRLDDLARQLAQTAGKGAGGLSGLFGMNREDPQAALLAEVHTARQAMHDLRRALIGTEQLHDARGSRGGMPRSG